MGEAADARISDLSFRILSKLCESGVPKHLYAWIALGMTRVPLQYGPYVVTRRWASGGKTIELR